MSRLYSQGFELAYSDMGGSINGTLPRSGGYCILYTSGGCQTPALPNPQTDLYIRWPMFIRRNSVDSLVRFVSDTGALLADLRFGYGTTMTVYVNNVSIGTASAVYPASTYTCFEVHFKLDATEGRFTIRMNGDIIFDYTGNTNPTGAAGINYVGSVGSGTTSSGPLVDDIAINNSEGSDNNSWPGDGRVYHLLPNGNGDLSEWRGSDGDSVDNYLLVDEASPSMADYVESATQGAKDWYHLTVPTLGAGDVVKLLQLQVVAQGANQSGVPQVVQVGIRSDGVEEFDPTIYPVNIIPGATTILSQNFPLDPATGQPWTTDAIAALQEGVKIP